VIWVNTATLEAEVRSTMEQGVEVLKMVALNFHQQIRVDGRGWMSRTLSTK
jgi:hypothetical protein